ncbi:MAG: DUF2807 domain-containing protein [Polaribacter sp.]|nr:DUF2807 domain-containing protein [Polaribacter sp.]MDG1811416.1 DUF2807 domain-containing protein [Polaribacter sp.]MDG1993625.1 DUF2807 domain-containing protein [Polaribacter sp.]
MKKLILTSIVLTITLSVNAQSWWNHKKVRGNGNVISEIRKTSDYKTISSAGNFDVKLVEGTEGNITLKGEENLMSYIITEVKRGQLTIKVKKNTNIKLTKKFIITVPFNNIDGVALAGSGDMTNSGTIKSNDFKVSLAGSGDIDLKVDANKIKTSIAGSGNIKLDGNANNLSCSVAGSGDIIAYGLKTKSVSVSVAGSGNVSTTVSESITVRTAGSGSVYYKGNPDKIDSKSAGSGSVVNRN